MQVLFKNIQYLTEHENKNREQRLHENISAITQILKQSEYLHILKPSALHRSPLAPLRPP